MTYQLSQGKSLRRFNPELGEKYLIGCEVYKILTRRFPDGSYRARVLDISTGSNVSVGDTRSVYDDSAAQRVIGFKTKNEKAALGMDYLQFAIDILEMNMDGMSEEDRAFFLQDVVQHGCQSGAVSGVIYSHEVHMVFRNHMGELLELLDEQSSELDMAVLGDIDYTDLPTKAVWFAVEYIAGRMIETGIGIKS